MRTSLALAVVVVLAGCSAPTPTPVLDVVRPSATPTTPRSAAPAVRSTRTPAVARRTTTTKASAPVRYKNCDAARAAHAAPIYRGQPGYRIQLDRNRDGVACEDDGPPSTGVTMTTGDPTETLEPEPEPTAEPVPSETTRPPSETTRPPSETAKPPKPTPTPTEAPPSISAPSVSNVTDTTALIRWTITGSRKVIIGWQDETSPKGSVTWEGLYPSGTERLTLTGLQPGHTYWCYVALDGASPISGGSVRFETS